MNKTGEGFAICFFLCSPNRCVKDSDDVVFEVFELSYKAVEVALVVLTKSFCDDECGFILIYSVCNDRKTLFAPATRAHHHHQYTVFHVRVGREYWLL